jgi:hypothetical protein
MNILEYCDALNVELKVIYYPNQHCRWSADLVGVEIKEGTILAGAATDGSNAQNAIDKLCANLRGKKIVFHAGITEMRREYFVPKDLGT